MRAWAARRIRAGIIQGRHDAELVAMFGDKPLGRKLDAMFCSGAVGPVDPLTVAAHQRTYERESSVWRGLQRLLTDIQSESEQADAGARAETDFGCCEEGGSCREGVREVSSGGREEAGSANQGRSGVRPSDGYGTGKSGRRAPLPGVSDQGQQLGENIHLSSLLNTSSVEYPRHIPAKGGAPGLQTESPEATTPPTKEL